MTFHINGSSADWVTNRIFFPYENEKSWELASNGCRSLFPKSL